MTGKAIPSVEGLKLQVIEATREAVQAIAVGDRRTASRGISILGEISEGGSNGVPDDIAKAAGVAFETLRKRFFERRGWDPSFEEGQSEVSDQGGEEARTRRLRDIPLPGLSDRRSRSYDEGLGGVVEAGRLWRGSRRGRGGGIIGREKK